MFKQRFKDKVVWITGASSGIGEACARAFASEGARLILTGRSEEKLIQLSQECNFSGGKSTVLIFDLSAVEQIQLLVEQALSIYGFVDILFNNAGISQRALAGTTSPKVEKLIFDINYFSPVLIAKEILPSMIQHGGGTIAVTTSIAGKFGFPLRSTYSASKHALYGFFESLHAENYHQNIRVVFVCPGRIKTNISLNAVIEDGQKHGVMDQGQAEGISAEKAAQKILKAIYFQKAEVLVGGMELIMVYLKRFFPTIVRKLIRKIKSS